MAEDHSSFQFVLQIAIKDLSILLLPYTLQRADSGYGSLKYCVRLQDDLPVTKNKTHY